MVRIFRNTIVVLLLSLALALPAQAEDVRVTAEVDRSTVELGSFCQLTLRVQGSQAASAAQLPAIPGLQSRYLGPSTSISVVNGQVSATKAFRYNLYPTSTGRVEIPSLFITVDGKEYKTDAIFLDVVATRDPNRPASSGSGESARLEDRIFVTLSVAEKDYYLHEAVPVVIKLFVNNVGVENIQYPQFDHVGFATRDYSEPKRYEQLVGGVRYQVVEFNTTAFPTRTGGLVLGPAKIHCQLVFRQPARAINNDPMNSFFNDNFFNNFFGNVDTRAVVLTSTDAPVNVLPLPDEGKPVDFSGGVGQYNFEVTVSPSQVKAGDPLTVKMALSGGGNVETVKMPTVAGTERLKTYDPQVNVANGVKNQDQVVIPLTDQVTEIPALAFTYFNPIHQKYQTIQQGPFPVKVAKADGGEAPKAVGLSAAEPVLPAEEKLGQDISFIKEYPGNFHEKGVRLARRPWFWIVAVFSFLAWAGLWIHSRVTARFKTDLKFARRMKAPKQARQGLLLARRHLDQGATKEFYDTVFKTLQDYFGNRFHVPAGTISVETVQALSEGQPKADGVAENLKTIFADCEQVRYASIPLDRERMRAVYERAEETIDLIERNWR